jgi:hypothetical protein
MVDFLDPLLPIVATEQGMTRDERAQAAADSLLRQKVLEGYLRGENSEDDFNDLLREQRWDPDSFWQTAEANVNAFINAGIVPEALEFLDSGLVIPRH